MFGEKAVCPDSLFVPAVFRESYFYLNSLVLCYCTPITITTPLLPFVKLPPLPTLYPFHLMLIVASLIFCS